ncbi:Alpha/Beta hydrolase protein [Gorgonomyces haynaldii]|nr:Alpha/Beta hydrolase protein [Gorgonomyces haynaldii]
MGFICSKGHWQPQMHYFAHMNGDKYSCLVVDNKGIGESTSPWLPRLYTTKSMAQDIAAIIKHIQWNQQRSLHLIGISMGGFISQELASLHTTWFKSISLLATASKYKLPANSHVESAGRWLYTLFPRTSVQAQMNALFETLIGDQEWLQEHDDRFPHFRNNKERMVDEFKRNLSIPRPGGFLGQISACLTHAMPEEKLKIIGELVPTILVCTGTADKLMSPVCSDILASHLNARLVKIPGKGHALNCEAEHQVNSLLEKTIEEGEKLWQQ